MTKTTKLLAISCVAVMFVACGQNLRKTVPPIEDVLKAGPLARIVVYVGNIALGESGPTPDGMNISIGGTSYLSAQGRDANNRPIKVSPSWQASKPELVEISPSSGDMVGVKGLREGTVEIVAEYKGVKRTINYIFIK